MADAPWYGDGLRFACTRCGNCCRGAPGSVRVSDAEIEALAARLELSNEAFRGLYTRTLRDGEVSLRERRGGDCVFYREGLGCSVYPDRPRQCRTWPFWSAVLHSRERWEEEAAGCPGMNHGPRLPAEWIAEVAANDGTRDRR